MKKFGHSLMRKPVGLSNKHFVQKFLKLYVQFKRWGSQYNKRTPLWIQYGIFSEINILQNSTDPKLIQYFKINTIIKTCHSINDNDCSVVLLIMYLADV